MAVVRGRAALPVLARVFGGIAAVLLLVVVVTALVRVAAISGDERADGVVVELRKSGRSFAPVVEFTPPGGPPVRFESGLASNPPAYQVGEHVGVLYPPPRPEDALIDGFWTLWFVPALAALIAAPFAIAAVVLFLVAQATGGRSRRPRASQDG